MRDIIVPATRETRCRYADLPELKGCFGPATVFMSHCWGATFGDLIGAACHGARKDRVVWIDIFAVRQWPGNVADLDFRGVISRCNALVVSTSAVDGLKTFLSLPTKYAAYLASDEGKLAKKATPFFRLWCIVELVAAIVLDVPIVVKGGSLTIPAFNMYEITEGYMYPFEVRRKNEYFISDNRSSISNFLIKSKLDVKKSSLPTYSLNEKDSFKNFSAVEKTDYKNTLVTVNVPNVESVPFSIFAYKDNIISKSKVPVTNQVGYNFIDFHNACLYKEALVVI